MQKKLEYFWRIVGVIFLVFATLATALNKYDWGWNNSASIKAMATSVAKRLVTSDKSRPKLDPVKEVPGSKARKTIILRIDDAKTSAYKLLIPIIQENGLPCELYVVATYIVRPGYMPEDQIKEVQKWCRVENHSFTHPDLTDVPPEQLVKEIEEAQRVLGEKFGRKPMVVASPMGKFNSSVLREIRKTHIAHQGAYGAEDPERLLKNYPVKGKFNTYELAGYDIKPNFSAQKVCDAIKEGEDQDQIMILVYHFAQVRGQPAETGDTNPFYVSLQKTAEDIPGELTVFEDVFAETAKCLREELLAGRIRMDYTTDALEHYEQLYAQQKQQEQPQQIVAAAPVRLAQYQPTEIVQWAMAPLQREAAPSTSNLPAPDVTVPMPMKRSDASKTPTSARKSESTRRKPSAQLQISEARRLRRH